jgi:DNA-binding XRE family transcriptional regulator
MAKQATKVKAKTPPAKVKPVSGRGAALGGGDLTPEEFGRRLRKARIEAGYESMGEAARKLGMSTLTSYNILENGQQVPGLSRIMAMVRVLGLDPATIVPEWFPEPRKR